MDSQKSLPFDKREYRSRMEAIEGMTPEATGLTERRLRKIQDLLKRVFKHNLSSPEGDLTFVRCKDPKRGQFSLVNDFFIPKRTLENYLNWAKAIGVIDIAIDCDAHGDRRSTMSIFWHRVKELGGGGELDQSASNARCIEMAQSAETVNQSAETAAQSASLVDQSAGNALSSKPIPIVPMSPNEEWDFGRVKMEIRSVGVRSPRCIELAIAEGSSLDEIREVIRHAKRQNPWPTPEVIYGRIRSMGRNPNLIHSPWPDSIARVQAERRADADHERQKLSRRNRIVASGETESSEGLGDVLRSEPPPELVAALDQELNRLNERFGAELDAMTDQERFDLAKATLHRLEMPEYQRQPTMYRDELLKGIDDRRNQTKAATA